MSVAAEQKFQLAMIYQGLDFYRNPLPAGRVAADFRYFQQHFARNPVFYRMGGKPLTIWSGTWAFSAADVAKVTTPVRPSMLVLSTEKSVAGYQRIAKWTDGDAYYWSSVNPDTNSGYAGKLDDMSAAIHPTEVLVRAVRRRLRRPAGRRRAAGRPQGRPDAADRVRHRARLLAGRARADQLERVQREHLYRTVPKVR